MPVRKEDQQTPKNQTVTSVDLTYLPEHYQLRINEIFDSYFGLGMRNSSRTSVDEYTPDFPNKLSALSSPQLGDMLGSYTAWYSFAIDKSKYVTVALNYVEQELAKELENELGKMVSDKGNIEAKKAKAKSMPSYMTVYSYTQKLRGLKTLLEMELTNFDRCIQTLSREISRREVNAGF